MSQFQSASVDFDRAREIMSRVKTEVDKIVDCTQRAHKAIETATQSNNMSELLNVQGGFDMLTTKVKEISGVPDEILRAVNAYEEMYDAEINDRQSAAGIFN